MKVWEVQKRAGFDALAIAERPIPQPKDGEVLVRIRAVSLNYRDILVVKEAHDDPNQPPGLIPTSDGAGEVVALGNGVQNFQLGDRVATCFMPDWTEGELTPLKQKSALGYLMDGALREYAAFPESALIHIPKQLSYEEASTLPCAALTAWNALQDGGISAGDTVLVQGTGGVSIFAMQFALLSGASVIATSSSDEKIVKLKEMGASLAVNYKKTPNWEVPVLKFTKGVGVDHVIEVGGADTITKSFQVVKYGGRISIIGHVAGDVAHVNLRAILGKNLTLKGIYVGSKKMFESMNAAIELHSLKPYIHKVFEFEQAREALEYMSGGSHFGKICVTI